MNSHVRREVLLVDDNPADLDLIREALSGVDHKPAVSIVQDGELAIAFLTHSGQFRGVSRPDLVILDLNLPRKDGRAVLANVKGDPNLRSIPIVLFTTSGSRQDVIDCYALGANCYVSKPGSLDEFRKAVQSIQRFWLAVARLPE
ncbi:MAG: response regulator [Acidobacteria bacterium]|nr:response regulator [Acidobacteriota bacterium]